MRVKNTCYLPPARRVVADTVVLVEGEKFADALASIGIVATTAMGGTATAIVKTDWTPLQGKAVSVWPDQTDAMLSFRN
jgi:putative DNA primase/helicase